ncbi:MAG: hypothetical protein NT014_04700 [Candidatus Omnitrophica bacterium]|nr:hypothetical protein [Candidatus Omnitrophota bacterium]
MDKVAYLQKQQDIQNAYEARCKRCGSCCGALGQDPCARLKSDEQGKFYCSDYSNRIGLQFTVTGKKFHCVPIRDLGHNLPFQDCAYFKHG